MSPFILDNIHEMPYAKGNVLGLTIAESESRRFEAKVIKVYSPFTMSCVMQVEVPGWVTGSKCDFSRAVLKMYDRRFANQLRRDIQVGEWSSGCEMAYLDFVHSDEAVSFVHRLREDDNFDDPIESFSDGQKEAYIYDWCSDLYIDETSAYAQLHHLQGREIPRLYHTIDLSLREVQDPDHSQHALTIKSEEDFLQVKGILIEWIDGITLSDLLETPHIPRCFWQTIVDQAVHAVSRMSDYDVRNEDVRPANFVVTHVEASRYRVVMIDFAYCVLRTPEQSDKEWGRDKWSQDEEGAVGVVMRKRMADVGFELEYKSSERYIEHAAGEFD